MVQYTVQKLERQEKKKREHAGEYKVTERKSRFSKTMPRWYRLYGLQRESLP